MIYDNLSGTEKEKWLKDVLISFFDDVEKGIPLSAWCKALSEAIKFSFMKSTELTGAPFVDFVIEQFLRFVGIAISFGEKQPVEIIVDLLTWIPSKVEFLNEKEFLEQISKKLLALVGLVVFFRVVILKFSFQNQFQFWKNTSKFQTILK